MILVRLKANILKRYTRLNMTCVLLYPLTSYLFTLFLHQSLATLASCFSKIPKLFLSQDLCIPCSSAGKASLLTAKECAMVSFPSGPLYLFFPWSSILLFFFQLFNLFPWSLSSDVNLLIKSSPLPYLQTGLSAILNSIMTLHFGENVCLFFSLW